MKNLKTYGFLIKPLLMCIALLVLAYSGLQTAHAQTQTPNLTLNLKDTKIEDILNEIEKQTGLSFLYNQKLIDLSEKLSIDVKNESISKVLDKIFTGLNVKYVIEGKQIILSDSALAAANASQSASVGTVSGIVKDKAGLPIPGVYVLIEGSKTGTSTGTDGDYVITIPSNQNNVALIFTFVGFQNKRELIGNRTQVNVTMDEDVNQLGEVVVTALGIKREKKALGYAVQEVKGEIMQKAKEPNILSSMTGKVAGLTVKNNPGLFENPEVTIRGSGNLLIVVDGIPRETNFWDINSDDVESMNVLKGPAAAALYGSRGKNGAVMITTKRGAAGGSDKVEVSVNSSFMFQPNFVYMPKTQHQYGQGEWGDFAYVDGKGGGTYDSDVYSWGPKLDQRDPSTASGYLELPQWNSPIDPATGKRIPIPFISQGKNNVENFFRTGNVISNNISIGATNERSNYRFSLTQMGQRGIDPNSRVDALTASFSGSQRFSKLFSIESAITYNKQYSENYPRTSYYADNNMYNILVWMSPDINVRDLKQYWTPGKEGVEQRNFNYAYYNNPYFIAEEYLQEYKKDVVYGYAKLLFDITPELKLSIRSNIDWFNRYTAEKRPKGFVGYSSGYANGGFYPSDYFEWNMNNEFLFTYDKTFNDDWTVNAVFGGNRLDYSWRSFSANATSLSVPGIYNLGNSAVPVTTKNNSAEKVVNSLYGSVNVGFKNMLYLAVTGRNDWSSSLPVKHNSYFYPSVSLSGIITEMVKLPEFISFAKVRGSWIRVGGDMDIYSTKPIYDYGTSWNGVPSINMNKTIYSKDIEPAFKTTYELGGEVRLLQNRLGLDVTYYNNLESNEIIRSIISNSTGYEERLINSTKKTKRTGWEIVLNASPIRTNDWNWNIGVNWSTTSEYLVRAENGKNGRDSYTKEGGKYGHIWYRDEADRSPDGQVIYGANGLTVKTSDPQHFGYEPSLWELGFNNRISYKNITLSFSIDGRWGGLLYSRLNQKLWESGKHADSNNEALRDADNRGEKTFIAPGVKVTGGSIERDAYGVVTSDTRTYAPNDTPVYYRSWVNDYYRSGYWTTSTFDASFFKLREVVIVYSIPKKWIDKTFLKSAEVSFIGRNLLLWTKEDGNVDPDSKTKQGESRLFVPTPRNIGFNIKLNF